MPNKIIQLGISNKKWPYQEIALALEKYKDEEICSIRFIVEGTIEKPLVAIDYPGRKMFKRELKSRRFGIARYANLFDFRVIPYQNGKPLGPEEFTFDKFLRDFKDNKSESEEFWNLLTGLYHLNYLEKEPPDLPGMNSKVFLLTLKWIWIEEDFNYKFKWEDIKSQTRYVLAKINTRTGKEQSISRGAGRAKFFATLVLLKRREFTYDEVKKIVPLFN